MGVPVRFQMSRSANDWRVRVENEKIASRETAERVGADTSGDLSDYGIGQVAIADLVRFTRPSPVFDNITPHERGVSGVVRPGWSGDDALREGYFETETTSMLVRSYHDEAAYHASGH